MKNVDSIMPALQELLRAVTDNPSLVVTESTSARNLTEWDSLVHLRFLSLVEKHFAIRLAISEVRALKNIGSLKELIEAKLA